MEVSELHDDKTQDRYLVVSTAILDQMRHQRQCTDVLLQSEDQSFPAHSIVLAASSTYFKDLFLSASFPTQSGMRIVYLPFVNTSTMAIVLDYLYSGSLHLPERTSGLRNLLLAGQRLRLADLPRHVVSQLEPALSPINFGNVWSIADEFDQTEMRNVVLKYLVKNFAELCRRRQFLDLAPHQMKLVYRQLPPVMEDGTHDLIMSSILSWVHADEENRSKDLVYLLRFIKLSKISPDYAVQLYKNEPLLRRADRIWRKLQGIATSLEMNSSSDECMQRGEPASKDFSCTRAPCRQPSQSPTPGILQSALKCTKSVSIFSTGQQGPNAGDRRARSEMRDKRIKRPRSGIGRTSSSLPVVVRTSSGSRVLTVDTPRHHVTGHLMTIIGRDRLGSVLAHYFSLERLAWLTPENLTNALARIKYVLPEGATWLDYLNVLYFAGGAGSYGGSSRSAIAFDIESGGFCRLEDMLVSRSSASSAVMDGFIYVIGGIGHGHKAISQMERYDITKDQWRHMHALPEPVAEAGTAVVGDLLYVVGGQSKGELISNCYTYCPRANQWSTIEPLPDCFCGTQPLAAAMLGCMYAVRYFNTSSVGSVAKYDPSTRQWYVARTGGFPPRKVMVALPRSNFLWVVDYCGKIFLFNTNTERWEKEYVTVSMMAEPLYAAILERRGLSDRSV